MPGPSKMLKATDQPNMSAVIPSYQPMLSS